MTLNDFNRLISPLKKKIFLLLGRGILKLINNAEGTQKIQVVCLDSETITDIERLQEYGFESYPLVDAEVLGVFVNGNRDQGVVLCVHDRRYRPQDLSSGDSAMYTYEDASTPFRVWLKSGRILFARALDFDFDVDQNMTENIGTQKTVTVPTESHVNSTSFTAQTPSTSIGPVGGGGISIDNAGKVGIGPGILRKLIDERFQALFNAHVHSGVQAGAGNTGAPTTSIAAGHMTVDTTAS